MKNIQIWKSGKFIFTKKLQTSIWPQIPLTIIMNKRCNDAVLIGVFYCIVYYLKMKIFSIKDDYLHIVWFLKVLGKWNIAIVFCWFIITYAAFTSFTYVTNDKIVVIKPWDLQGQEYTYLDVEGIETGFGNKKFSFYEHEEEGNFYYKISVGGETIVFHMTSVNPSVERYEDTYLELEEFDEALMKHMIPKEASSEGYDKCNFDKRYVDRFLRIIESK